MSKLAILLLGLGMNGFPARVGPQAIASRALPPSTQTPFMEGYADSDKAAFEAHWQAEILARKFLKSWNFKYSLDTREEALAGIRKGNQDWNLGTKVKVQLNFGAFIYYKALMNSTAHAGGQGLHVIYRNEVEILNKILPKEEIDDGLHAAAANMMTRF